MRPSSQSPSLSTLVPIKVVHRQAKKKRQRRKRIDLGCGCSVLVHPLCNNYGFSHRGIHHCSSSAEWNILLGTEESNIHNDNRTHRQTIQHEPRHTEHPNQVQPQSEEGFRDSQMLLELQGLDEIEEFDISVLEDF
uniref:Transcriptional activator protein n=1 Tax=Asystasia mosaic Madagascar virus TaxID=1611435 RepID=A0A0C5BIF8_9GEMI|nr:transcriptional activator protein [Asystasia mosaic Madagascar virus]